LGAVVHHRDTEDTDLIRKPGEGGAFLAEGAEIAEREGIG